MATRRKNLAAPRSVRLWFEPREAAELSDYTKPKVDIFACPSSLHINTANNEREATDLCAALNAAVLQVYGI